MIGYKLKTPAPKIEQPKLTLHEKGQKQSNFMLRRLGILRGLSEAMIKSNTRV